MKMITRIVLKDLIRKKQKEIKPEINVNVREKIIAYVHNKGYEMELILIHIEGIEYLNMVTQEMLKDLQSRLDALRRFL